MRWLPLDWIEFWWYYVVRYSSPSALYQSNAMHIHISPQYVCAKPQTFGKINYFPLITTIWLINNKLMEHSDVILESQQLKPVWFSILYSLFSIYFALRISLALARAHIYCGASILQCNRLAISKRRHKNRMKSITFLNGSLANRKVIVIFKM